jgi:hypothetical protein
MRMEEDGSPLLIASREKAMCDLLCKKGAITNIRELETLLYDDLRIERDSLISLNLNDLEFLAPLYRKKSISLLLKYLKKGDINA